MFGIEAKSEVQQVEFLLLPNFSMMAFTSTIEPLRSANRMADTDVYSWRTVTLDGGSVRASNGVSLTPDGPLGVNPSNDALFVCSGLMTDDFENKSLHAKLRDLVRARVAVGSVCTGTIALARAGLLDGYRCTIHWENVEGFVEDFPYLDVTATLFEIDRDRFTCSGGTAPLDMMLYSISKDHGLDLAINVAEQMLHNFVRQPHEQQRMSIQHRTGITNAKLLAAMAHMEAYVETPLPVGEIASAVEISARQLERLFKTALNVTPTRYYLELRLHKAKLLLAQTTMPVLQIAVATGFTSAAHFAKSYRSCFGYPPSAERVKEGKNSASSSQTV